MAKVSPIQATFNGGVWGPLMGGRVDHERYGAAVRRAFNVAPISQGPMVRRSGFRYTAPVIDHAKMSRVISFEYSDEDAFMLEFAEQKMRVLREDGPLIRPATAVTVVSASPNTVESAGHGASIGEHVFLSGFDATSPLNNALVKITNAVGDVITFDPPTGYTAAPTLAGGETVARVFTMATPYDEAAGQSLHYLQSADVLFAFTPSISPRGIGRYAAYDWRCNELTLNDGPYLDVNKTATKLTPTSTGNEIPNPPASGKTTSSGDNGAHVAAHGTDADPATFWESSTAQAGWLAYEFPSATVIRSYVIRLAQDQSDATYSWKDYAPLNFTFEGWDGAAWVVLDTKTDYVLWDGGRSVQFDIENSTAYDKYRLNITGLSSNGSIKARVGQLLMMQAVAAASTITFDASAVTGINRDQGFLATDEGRVMRFKGSDGWWRWYTIETVNTTTQIECRAHSDALPDIRASTEWRLGLWSDTTGWPTRAYFSDDRMWIGGSLQSPDKVPFTTVGGYGPTDLYFSPTDPNGVVSDANGGVAVLNAKKVGAVRWIDGDDKNIIVGTLNGPWAIGPADTQKAMSATNIKARPLPRRGCADADPLHIDAQILFIPRAGRSLRELAYDAQTDGYKVPSMSLYATHLGTSAFQSLAYTEEPHSIAWVRRADGWLLGFTYNREEGAIGWHEHAAGGVSVVIEDIADLPSIGGADDVLWAVIKRTIGGQTRRYIEVLQPFWREGNTLDDVFFFDSGLVYEGEPTSVVNGLWHLEGQTVGITADGSALPMQVVTNGQIMIPFEASRVVAGLPYDSEGETMRPNAGASDGTAQGKTKRVHNVTFRLWQSQGGQYARTPAKGDTAEWNDFLHEEPDPLSDVAPELVDGDYHTEWPAGYDTEGTILFRQEGRIGHPFNVVAIMPQLVTQDRG